MSDVGLAVPRLLEAAEALGFARRETRRRNREGLGGVRVAEAAAEAKKKKKAEPRPGNKAQASLRNKVTGEEVFRGGDSAPLVHFIILH